LGSFSGNTPDALCGAVYGERSAERTNSRNGYRQRRFDTRAGSLELAIPKLRQGSYFPDWLLERRKRAEPALTTVVATCYLLGVSTRRMDRLVETLGITGLSKSQVSVMAKELDAAVAHWSWRSPSCARAPISRTGCSSDAIGTPLSWTQPFDVLGRKYIALPLRTGGKSPVPPSYRIGMPSGYAGAADAVGWAARVECSRRGEPRRLASEFRKCGSRYGCLDHENRACCWL
jgi:hypothetical protein